ncbi:YchJ family metal-binding protein [Edwardsiella tarda]|uniref:YchJ family metal-binding protein n=1 Tax=Edwardsiella tarda TaxID=636 RepID=UPI0034DCEC78
MMSPIAHTTPCPCGSTLTFAACCAPRLDGSLPASTPEQLMRSRYSAFVTHNADYLIASWHPDCGMAAERAAICASFADTEWLGLRIIACSPGQNEHEGYVEFIARFHTPSTNRNGAIHERSRFLNLHHTWYYVDGTRPEVGRNAPCPCASGNKYKKCCGR